MTRATTPPDELPIPWATWIESRMPQFKVHATIGQAKNALSQSTGQPQTINGHQEWPIRGGYLYQIVNDKWQLVAHIPSGSFRHEHPLWAAAKQWKKAPGITTVIVEQPFAA